MNKNYLWLIGLLLTFGSCNKQVDPLIDKTATSLPEQKAFTAYTIKKGAHAASHNYYKTIETSALKFMVRFDSSAIYQTIDKANQYDINKLYGFSDNNAHHHQYSARFGWGWSDGALRLYAYVYNDGKVFKQELSTVAIGTDINCSIQVEGSNYIFYVNDLKTIIPRSSTTTMAKGYWLYPYFGGDETAPHDIIIFIKNL